MAKKKKNRGGLNTVSSMRLMAHKLGVNSSIKLTDTVITEQTFEYKIVFKDAPVEDWHGSPDDISAVNQNRRAVIFDHAMMAAAKVGLSMEDTDEDEDKVYFNSMLSDQLAKSQKTVSEFIKWYGKEDCETDAMHKYLFDIFYHEAESLKTKKHIADISYLVCTAGCEMSSVEFRELINPFIPFGVLEYEPPLLHEKWVDALRNRD